MTKYNKTPIKLFTIKTHNNSTSGPSVVIIYVYINTQHNSLHLWYTLPNMGITYDHEQHAYGVQISSQHL